MTDDLEKRLLSLSPAERVRLRRDMEALARRQLYNRLAYFEPYPKQLEFAALTGEKEEAALFAGNQTGKSECGAWLTAVHATGRYPKNWQGRRYDKQGLRIWVAGPSGQSVRDIEQRKLFGEPGIAEALGKGMIPKECIIGKPSASRSAPDAFDTAHIRHENGSITALSFKSYDQKREVWQGDPVDFVWCDEEAPIGHYTEAQARTSAVHGSIICTFTPLLGRSQVVISFLEQSGSLRGWLRMGKLDALHFTEADVARDKERYPQHEWDARIYGMPAKGEGAVFTAHRSTVEWSPPAGTGASGAAGRWAGIPHEWLKIGGMDFGIGHPFAYALCAWDRETDNFYVLDGFRIANELVIQHAKRIRDIGGNVPVAWPQDGHQRDRQSGEELAKVYTKEGVLMLGEHATLPDGSNSFYASIAGINELMNAGKWRVNRILTDWFSEFESYHYKDGQIVKLMDDFLSATRYAWMMRRKGKAGPIIASGPVGMARDRHRPITNFDLFTGRPFPEGDPRRYV